MIKRLLILMIFCCTFTAQASDSPLDKIKEKIENLKQLILHKQDTQSTLVNDLSAMEGKINHGNNQLRQINQKIRQQEAQLKPLLVQQRKIEQALADERVYLAKQLLSAYQTGDQNMLQILLGGDDPNQLERTMTYYQALNTARAKLIATYLQNLETVKQNQRSINNALQQLQTLRDSQLQAQTSLKTQEESRATLLKKINAQIKTSQQRVNQLEADKVKLEQVVANLNSDQSFVGLKGIDFVKLRGKLPWPTSGRITRRYGQVFDERLISNGVFISAAGGIPVRAIASGQVIFANYLRGYGNLIIVSHKGGYMTLYAHNNALFKVVGDTVDPGDELGITGNSGGIADNGLYFEIRYQGKPRDPMQWCRGKPRANKLITNKSTTGKSS